MKKHEIIGLITLALELAGALAFAALGHAQLAGTLVLVAIAHAAPSAIPKSTPPAETPHETDGPL